MTSVVSIHDYAEKALVLSKRMLTLAHNEDWQAMIPLEEQRQRILQKLFQHPCMPADLPDVADTLQQVMDHDAESIALGIDARKRFASELNSGNRGANVISLYQDNI